MLAVNVRSSEMMYFHYLAFNHVCLHVRLLLFVQSELLNGYYGFLLFFVLLLLLLASYTLLKRHDCRMPILLKLINNSVKVS